MHSVTSRLRLYILSILSLALCLTAMSAQAVPSFARQTGMPCQSCHTIFPELTAFGRSFKLNGYTMTSIDQIKGPNASDLSLNNTFPLSAMLQTGFTHMNKGVQGEQNNNVEFPQALSLYYAGEISPHMGAFLQVTYEQQEGSFSFDMADFRYANRTTLGDSSLVYGVTLNNAPGMEDVWNTTPAWKYPYTSSGTAQAPGEDPLVNSFMNVAGLGGYALWDNHWYGAVSFYRSAPQGTGAVATRLGSVDNLAPYIRLAWQGYLSNQGYLEVGAYALNAAFTGGKMGSGAPTLSDKYTDIAVDATYQQPMGNSNLLSLHAVYINEKQTLDSTFSGNPGNTLRQTRIDGNYEFGHYAQLSLGYFSTQGDSNAAIYSTYRTTSPDSAGFTAEADYLPWENTKFSIQYTNYTKFDGASSNYNGAGRNASDNNTLYLNAWWMW